ncbi:MAG: DUF3443 family protein [Janthinobacterium lividum]
MAGLAYLVLAALALWCGPAMAQDANMVPLTAETPVSGFNRLTVSVTVCEPGANSSRQPSRCATIDHVMVDTGSVGLRLQARAVPRWLNLPALQDGSGRRMAQCLRFLNNAAWGGLHRADVRLGGQMAADIPIQVVGVDLPRPASCSDGGHPTSNGTLGIGIRGTDCEGDCVQGATHPTYMACGENGCAGVPGSVPAQLRVVNPVQHFPGHDNGVVIDMPMPPRRGVAQVQGVLIFGVDTAVDNQLGASRILRIDQTGHFTTRFDGIDYPRSYIDSGTEYVLVPGSNLPRCRTGGAALCLDAARQFVATMQGADRIELPMSFLVGRFPRSGERGVFASAAMASSAEEKGFVWGAPFFMGRRISLVFRDKSVPGMPGISGPFYAERLSSR